jgi:hypothetical protein
MTFMRANEALTATNDQETLDLEPQFCLCGNCFWSASILFTRMDKAIRSETDLQNCPQCGSQTLSFLPLAHNEGYRLRFGNANNVELEFFECRRANVIAEAH